MRRRLFAMPRGEALHFLEKSKNYHIAAKPMSGELILRTLHAVVHEGDLAFHGGQVGERTQLVGADVVVNVENIVAELPSYFFDPDYACPATTWYQSVQVKGVLEPVTDSTMKASILQGFMEKYQPEGRYVSIDANNPMYTKALDSLWVVRVSLERMVGRSKLGQHKKPETLTRIMEQLWKRGRPQDLKAIELIRGANPEASPPEFLKGDARVTLHCDLLDPEETQLAGRMVEDAYWNPSFSATEIATAFENSTAVVVARCRETGRLVGFARAMSDFAKHAWLYDVYVDRPFRETGVGKSLIRLLLKHPAVRSAQKVHLSTKDAQGFYQVFGFQDIHSLPPRPWSPTRMILQRET